MSKRKIPSVVARWPRWGFLAVFLCPICGRQHSVLPTADVYPVCGRRKIRVVAVLPEELPALHERLVEIVEEQLALSRRYAENAEMRKRRMAPFIAALQPVVKADVADHAGGADA